MTVSLVSLDMAGTTIDEGGIVYDVLQATVEDATGAVIPRPVLDRWTGTDKREALAGLLDAVGADGADIDALYAELSRRLDEAYATASVALFPGVREAIAGLRATGVKVALQTGYRREVAEGLRDAVDWRVGRDVDALATSDEVPASRPAPYLLFRNLQDTGVADVRRLLAEAGELALSSSRPAGVVRALSLSRGTVGASAGAARGERSARGVVRGRDGWVRGRGRSPRGWTTRRAAA